MYVHKIFLCLFERNDRILDTRRHAKAINKSHLLIFHFQKNTIFTMMKIHMKSKFLLKY